ncbi:hypothetical protein EON65_29440 [archaeon]|nr:MAG: hypothetical protein EON65_29440 [archaeon]
MADLSGAENRMTSLEARIAELEKSAVSASSGDNSHVEVELAIKKYQHQILGKLKAIKEALVSEGGDSATLRQERDDARAENAALKKEIERLNYRVRHLVKALNEEEARNAGK